MNWFLISPENEHPNELDIIHQLSSYQFSAYHVRKPKWKTADLTKWLAQFSEEVLSKIVIHYHYHVASEFPVKGFHMNRDQRMSDRFQKKIASIFLTEKWQHLSAGFHHIDSLKTHDYELTHAWLSPIYPSISKSKHVKIWDQQTWKVIKKLRKFEAVALGGITPDKENELTERGFKSAAVKGYIWQNKQPLKAIENWLIKG